MKSELNQLSVRVALKQIFDNALRILGLVCVNLRIYEAFRQIFLRMRKDFCNRSFFDYLSVFHHGNRVGKFTNDVHLMRDDHDRQVEFLVDPFKQIKHFVRCLRIKGARCFVRNQNIGIIRQCSGNSDALLLTSGKLCGISMNALAQSNDFCQMLSLLFARFFIDARKFQRKFDVLQNGSRPQQIEMLKNRADFFALLAKFGPLESVNLFAVDDDFA